MSHDFGGLRAVNKYDLQIESGAVRGLIGPNGAGKTTIFDLITGIYTPSEGKILFDGKLKEIIKKYADHKLIKVIFDKDIDAKKLEKIAPVKEYGFPSAILMVKRKKCNEAAAQLLKSFPIADLNIEEPSIEDIIREVFTGKDVA